MPTTEFDNCREANQKSYDTPLYVNALLAAGGVCRTSTGVVTF